MKTCENCGGEHKGEYGSGRFCTSKCSRGFSTKAKRAEINAKVSKKLKAIPQIKTCPSCKKEFESTRNKHCSKSCAAKGNGGWKNHKTIDWSCVNKASYASGKNYVAGGTTKWLQYKDIKVQGTYELRTCFILDRLKELNEIKDWKYAAKKIPYIVDDQLRTYIIDFEILSNDNNFKYVEVKGRIRENDEVKWNAAKSLGLDFEVWFNKDIYEKELLYL